MPCTVALACSPHNVYPALPLAYQTTHICLHEWLNISLTDFVTDAGWLITTSAGLLNLWTCTCIGSPGEPALHLVHALETEFLTSDMQIDPKHRLLMAVGRDTKAFTECVALHHLKLQPGVFRLKGRLNLPCGVTGRLARNTGPPKALQVIVMLVPLFHKSSQQTSLLACCLCHHQTLCYTSVSVAVQHPLLSLQLP